MAEATDIGVVALETVDIMEITVVALGAVRYTKVILESWQLVAVLDYTSWKCIVFKDGGDILKWLGEGWNCQTWWR